VTARLVAIAGPLEGRGFAIESSPFAIGRHSSNALAVRDLSVSRRHCELRAEGDSWTVRDLESRLGTFVNGTAVRDRRLEHGDLLRIGGTLLLYLREEADGPSAPAAIDFVAETTVRVPVADERDGGPEWLLATLGPEGRSTRQLAALLGISRAVQRSATVEALARQLLDRLAEVLPAERLALLLETEAGAGLRAAGVRGGEEEPAVSRTVAERAIGERQALLCNDVRAAAAYGAAESLRAERVRSLLCVPLVAGERCFGVLYADAREPGVRFEPHHLRFLTAVAAIAAVAVEDLRRREWLEAENERLRRAEGGYGMIGESAAMRKVYDFIARVAPTDATVLLRGESGTGKEVAARAIHAASRRRGGPFVAFSCAALSETLLESELFGHERGAFTGAIARKAGRLELADEGTVFLDEVGEIRPALQAKLLRVLEERRFERVGGTRPIEVDIRLIAATNRDLEKAIADGSFRDDLYFRLNVVSLTLPPLRRRRGDVGLLANHFAALYGERFGRPVAGIDEAARACLEAYDWPGNVRELANAIERAVVLGDGDAIHPEDLPEALLDTGSAGDSAPSSYQRALTETKRRLILDAMAEASGNVTRAAEKLGLHPNYLHRLLTNLGLRDRLER